MIGFIVGTGIIRRGRKKEFSGKLTKVYEESEILGGALSSNIGMGVSDGVWDDYQRKAPVPFDHLLIPLANPIVFSKYHPRYDPKPLAFGIITRDTEEVLFAHVE